MNIPLDINNPEIPSEVLLSNLASQIREICSGYRIPIPVELKAYVEKHDNDMAGYDWMTRLQAGIDDMSTELLVQWVSILPSCLCRGFMRAALKKRALSCTCGNLEMGFDCVCDWVRDNPGRMEYNCEFCGIYKAGAPRCDRCEAVEPPIPPYTDNY